MNIEELFDNEKWVGYGIVITDDANQVIDYLKEEVMEYIAELEKELAEEARLNGMGAEREAKLLARVAELEKRIAELEAQVPKAVKPKMMHRGWETYWLCNCATVLDSTTGLAGIARFEYCPYCGSKLNWEEV